MKTKLTRVHVALFGMAAMFALAGAGQALHAQDVRSECRCVDADGNEIERCSCLRTPVLDNLIERYGVDRQRARLGVSVDAGQAARYDTEGARVSDVLRGGPADDAGIREGDVIVRLNGQALTESIGADLERSFDLDGSAPVQRLLALAGELEPGQEVEIDYLREGERRSTVVEADDLTQWGSGFGMAVPSWDAERFRGQMRALTDGMRGGTFRFDGPDRDVRIRFQGPDRDQVRVFGGGEGFLFRDGGSADRLDLVELNPGLGAYFGVDEGVLVLDADSESSLGLEPGDVVLAIGDRPVDGPARLRRILSSYGEDEEVTFRIVRDGDEMTVTGRRGR